jgi:cellulose synthase/poly-beta-1,6-N-acetylglucosamine synthase-like glycosyltransferase
MSPPLPALAIAPAALLAWAVAAALFAPLATLAALLLARRPRAVRAAAAPPDGRVDVVVPFRGLDDDAPEKRRAVLRLRPRPARILFVTETRDDPGVPAARAACREAPGLARLLFALPGGLERVPSGKARNMLAGWRAGDAPFVAFVDSDMAPPPETLARCLERLADPRVGGVFVPCAFAASDAAGALAGLLGRDGLAFTRAAQRLGRVAFMQGGFMVVRRAAVEAAGGIERIADAVGDDLELSAALREAGWRLEATD